MCDCCERLKQSSKQKYKDFDKRFADLGKRVKALEMLEDVPEDWRPPRIIKPNYVDRYVSTGPFSWETGGSHVR